MKMHDVIEGISTIYRQKRGDVADLLDERSSIVKELEKASYAKGKHITVAEYNNLMERKKELDMEILKGQSFYEGISLVREYLMDLGFETKVE